MKIKVLGENISREEAYDIIVSDFIIKIIYSGNKDGLKRLLLGGWESLIDWSDKELEDFIGGININNHDNYTF